MKFYTREGFVTEALPVILSTKGTSTAKGKYNFSPGESIPAELFSMEIPHLPERFYSSRKMRKTCWRRGKQQ
jgi:hypothetical protein